MFNSSINYVHPIRDMSLEQLGIILTTLLIFGSIMYLKIKPLIFSLMFSGHGKKSTSDSSSASLKSKYDRPHIKPIFLTNNIKKAQEVSTLFGFPIDVLNLNEGNETSGTLDLVTQMASEKFRPTMREEIEVTIDCPDGIKKFDIGKHITEDELNKFIGHAMSINLKVFVAEPGSAVRVFYNTTNGKIVPKSETINSLCFGWDNMFVPNGYLCTVAELGQQRNMFNFRSQVYEQIADYLSGRPSTSTDRSVMPENQ